MDAKWSGFRLPFEYRKARPFEYRFLKYWSGIQMVGLVHRTKPKDRLFEYVKVKVCSSDVSIIQMFVIQIPTVPIIQTHPKTGLFVSNDKIIR